VLSDNKDLDKLENYFINEITGKSVAREMEDDNREQKATQKAERSKEPQNHNKNFHKRY
jgi:hypothetical protein